MSRDSGGDSGSIRWISLSAQIQKTEERKKKLSRANKNGAYLRLGICK